MKKKKTWIIAAIAIVVIIAVCWTLSGTKANSQVDFVTEKTRTGSVSNSITATGTIEPVTEVEVGTQVSGIIDKNSDNSLMLCNKLLQLLERFLTHQIHRNRSDICFRYFICKFLKLFYSSCYDPDFIKAFVSFRNRPGKLRAKS